MTTYAAWILSFIGAFYSSQLALVPKISSDLLRQRRNLLFVRSYDGNFEDLALNFVVVEDRFGEAKASSQL